MKTKTHILKLFIAFLCLGSFATFHALETKNSTTPEKEVRKQACISQNFNTNPNVKTKGLTETFNKMHKDAAFVVWKGDQFCKPKDLINKTTTNDLTINERASLDFIGSIEWLMEFPNYETIDKGVFKTVTDKVLSTYSSSSNFNTFFNTLTGSDIGDAEKHYVDGLRFHYNYIKSFLKTPFTLNKKNIKNGNCTINILSTIKAKTFNYPKISWDIKTKVTADCNCPINDAPSEIKYGVFEYTATASGLFTKTKITFESPNNPKLEVLQLFCCKGDIPTEEEPTKTSLNESGINNLMPDQSIGFGAGVGFAQDFKETTFCLSAEYLKKISSGDDKGWYIGAEGSYSNTSFGDFSSNKTMVGGKIQHNFSAVPSGETQFVVGLMANFAFGNNDNNGFKDDFTGVIACAYTGVNIRVCEDWSIGGQFPFFIYESFTFKPESGDEFKTDGTSLFINKNNPAKLIIRYHF